MNVRTIARLALALALACSSKRKRQDDPPLVPEKTATPAVAVSPEAWWSALPELPPGTFDVSISSFALEGPPEAQWSWVAGAICAEHDAFLFETPMPDSHPREGLRCGRTLIEHLPAGARRYVLDVNRAAHDHPLPLFVVPTTYTGLEAIEPLLSGFHREAVGDATVLCRTFGPSPKTCAERHDPNDKALAVIGNQVIAGAYVALAELLQWSARDRVLAVLPQLAGRAIEIDLLPRGGTWTIGPRRWLPYSRSEAEVLAEVVRIHARSVGHEVEWGAGSGSITLVPRCSTPACPERAALATALRTYQRAWAAEAPARMRALMDEAPGLAADCARPMETAMIEQVTHAEVTATNVVELRFSLPAGRLAELEKARPASCHAEDDKRTAEGVARVRAAI